MALTTFQRAVCRLLADHRIASGESYVAGASALNELIAAPRVSMDIDLFHDTDEALAVSWETDRALLEKQGYDVRVVRERPSFVEAEVIQHPDLGLALHPFDLATNKVLTLVGRLEARDWVDLIHAGEHVQPLGYLAWAASGKDPGFSPGGILMHASRSARYSAAEVLALSFVGQPPDPADLSRRWHATLTAAERIVDALPPPEVGRGVLDRTGRLFTGDVEFLRGALSREELIFHAGRIRGALPQVKERRSD